MPVFKAAVAVMKGVELCVARREVRKYAMWPWLVGTFCYIASLISVYFVHPILLDRIVGSPEGFWATALFYLAWLFFGLILLVLSMFISAVTVIIFTAVFQTEIAIQVLTICGHKIPPEASGITGVVKEGGRAIAVETGKLLWMVPLFIVITILGFIPILTPFALAANAWLLSYQFVDVVLDIFKTTSRQRFAFARRNGIVLCVFGLSLTFLWAVPFLGILLPPAAVAGAAWLLSETSLLEEFEDKSS
jgi:uncharacterized protein involved in cysteine biosynthesis